MQTLDRHAAGGWRRRRWIGVAASACLAGAILSAVLSDAGEPEFAVRTETPPPDSGGLPTVADLDGVGRTTTSISASSTTTSNAAPAADPIVSAQRRRPSPPTTVTTAVLSTTTSTVPATTTSSGPTAPTRAVPPADPCGHSGGPARTLTDVGLYVAPINGDAPQRILGDSGLDPNDVVASPDGQRLFFTVFDRSNDGQNPFELYTANIDGSGLRRLDVGTQHPQNLSWSPDGRWVAFNDQSPRGAGMAVWVIHPDGSERHKVWDNPSRGSGWIRWAPDSTRIATNSSAADGGAWVIDLATKAATKIESGPVWAVDWAPDGKRLVVDITVTVPIDPEPGYTIDPAPVVIVNADGTGRRQLVEDGISPLWSPAGDGIALYDGRIIDPDTLVTRRHGYGAGIAIAYSRNGEHLGATGFAGIWVNDRKGCATQLFTRNGKGASWRGWAGLAHVLVELDLP